MANLNLSEFGEKLFVADADHTFVWDTENAISKRVSRNSWLNSGTLTSDAPVTISQTWATTGTYTAAKVVATETATAATDSNLLELWSGSTPALKASVRKNGTIISKAGLIQSSGYQNVAGASLELFYSNCGLGLDVNANTAFIINSIAKTRCGAGVATSSDQPIGWTNSTHVGTSATLDTILLRDGEADHLAMRRTTNGQKFSVYGTYPGAAWERFTITAPTSGNVLLGTYKGTGGIARGLEIQTDGVTRITIGASGNTALAGNNNSISGYRFYDNGSANILIDSIGVGGLNRISFGGNSASFPSLKRVGAEFQIVKADTTAANNVAAVDADMTFIEDRFRRKGDGSPEGVVTAPIGAVYHRTDGGAGTSFYVKESGTGNTGWVGK